MLLPLLTILSAPALPPGPPPVRVSPPSAWVVWPTSEHHSNGTVRLGTSAGVYTANVQDTSYAEEHHVQLTGLLAGTTYHYAIDTDPAAQDSTFTTPPGGPVTSPIRFVVYGDNRTNTADHQSVANAIVGESGISFVLHTAAIAQNYPLTPAWDQ